MTEDHDELTDHEREALRALPRERPVDVALEERTVAALRQRGLLGGRGIPPARWSGRWIGIAMAASIALFATGVAVGQWLGARSTVEVAREVGRQRDAFEAALAVQEAGSAYVLALESLAQIGDSASAEQVRQGRQAAIATLHSAAARLVRLAPDDEVAAQILQGLARTRADSDSASAGRQVIWF